MGNNAEELLASSAPAGKQRQPSWHDIDNGRMIMQAGKC